MRQWKSCLQNHYTNIIAALIILFIPRLSSSQMQWNAVPSPFADKTLYDISFCNGYFIAINNKLIAYSADGISWNVKEIDFECTWGKVAYGNSTYVGVCLNGGVWTSTDLSTFTTVDSLEKNANHSAVAFGKETFVIAEFSNSSQAGETFSGWSLVSGNGTDWTKHSLESFNSVLLAAVYQNDMFTGVGAKITDNGMNGIILTSSDGINWTGRTPEDTNLTDNFNYFQAIAYGNNKFVTVGSNCGIIVSDDGINWSCDTTNSRCAFNAISYGNGYFITGGGSCLFYSTDAETWEEIPLTEEMNVNGIAFGNGRFVINCNRQYFFVSDPIPSGSKALHSNTQKKSIPVISFRDNILQLTLPPGTLQSRPDITCVNNLGRSAAIPFHVASDGKMYADMHQLPAGAYFLSVNIGGIIFKERFIKTR